MGVLCRNLATPGPLQLRDTTLNSWCHGEMELKWWWYLSPSSATRYKRLWHVPDVFIHSGRQIAAGSPSVFVFFPHCIRSKSMLLKKMKCVLWELAEVKGPLQISNSIHPVCFSRSRSDATSEWCIALFIKNKMLGSKVGARRGTQRE